MLSFVLTSALSLAVLGQTDALASSQDFALEVKFGPYRPHIDKGFPSGEGPYAKVFGKRHRLLSELEFDWQFFHGFGSVGVGVSGGYVEAYGNALDETQVPTTQTTSLKIIPLKLLLVWRMDIFANRYDIPFVPYAKLGLVMSRWWVQKGGKTSEVAGEKASGWQSGWLAVLGLSIQLDAFDRQLAKDIDTSLGVNHSYVFAEYAFEQVRSFSSKGLNLSSGHWAFGLAFEF